ncbi:magnesium transporter [Salinigranum marinum]|uniref:magnesium transporter n=1 Tax=Salinigranum marinum TaxID=1515595 RepID=UPI002989CF64|nr:magnesium transporter [Salinigranum marinum]
MALGVANGTIRSITSTEIPTYRPADTTEAVLDGLVGRTWDSADTVYILDDRRLVGRVDIAELLRAANDVPASRLMKPATARLHPDAGRERAVFLAIEKDKDEIPVVDGRNRLLGAVTSQAIIDTMHREQLEDALVGAGIQQTGPRFADLAGAGVRVAVRSRAPWLLFGLLVGLFLSVISSRFEAILRGNIALAFFAPVVAYIADSVGTQSEAIAVRAFAVTEVDYGSYLRRELLVGLVIGLVIGGIGGLGAALIASSPGIGLVVGLSLFVSSAVATVLASLIPIGFVLLDVDPALGSGPLATALHDVISILIYFAFVLALL